MTTALTDFLIRSLVGVTLKPEDFPPTGKTLHVEGDSIPVCLDGFRTTDDVMKCIGAIGHYCVTNGCMIQAVTNNTDKPWVVNFILKKQ